MQRLSFLAFLAVAVAALGAAIGTAASTGDSAVERDIRAAEQQMHDAYVKHNVPLFASLYADDSTFTFNTGHLVGKAERVKRFTAPTVDLVDTIEKVRVWGNVAIVNDISEYHNSKHEPVKLQIIRVWMKRDGKWQVVAFQSTPLSVSALSNASAE